MIARCHVRFLYFPALVEKETLWKKKFEIELTNADYLAFRLIINSIEVHVESLGTPNTWWMNEHEKEAAGPGREMAASPQWDQFIRCLSKAGLVSARVIHFSTLIRIWASNRLDHSYQFVLLHRPSVIPPLALCNLSKTRRMSKTSYSIANKRQRNVCN